jgi:hypothetical protein
VGLPSAVDAVILLLLASLHAVAASLFLQESPCFWWHPYCVVGPVAALIPAVACIRAVVRTVMILLSFLMLLVASVTVPRRLFIPALQ